MVERYGMSSETMNGIWIVHLLPLWLLSLVLYVTCQQPQQQLKYAISEELELGTFVGNVKSDANLHERYTAQELEKVKFRFLSTPDLDFTLAEDSGFIWTADRIDRDVVCPKAAECVFNLDIVVLIPENMRFLEIIKIELEIEDLNDNFPQFPEPKISHRISESAMPGTGFVIPTAIDPDSEHFGIQGWELSPTDSKFDLHMRNKVDGSVELRIVLKEVLDREEENYYDMKVIAYDGGQPPKTGSMEIHVEIQDTNDNDPVFTNTTYEAKVAENIPIYSTILRVTAHDLDIGVNGEVLYAFSTQTKAAYGHLFGIRNKTGEIYTKSELDYEKGAVYHLSVMAHDQGPDSIPADTTVIIRVLDINDNKPQITINTLAASGTDAAEISEDAKPYTFVAHLTVSDPDSGGNGEFTCSLANKHFALEQMYSGEYKIINLTPLDRETRQTYNLQITCKDNGASPQFAIKNLQVTVVDINDNIPIFRQEIYTAAVVENNLVGAVLLHVNATDDDIGDYGKVHYFLEDKVTNLFYINQNSGTIMAKAEFDHEKMQNISFVVTAVDGGDPAFSTSVPVYIKIEDENDEFPTFYKERYFFNVHENKPQGTVVGAISAVDLDSDPYNQFEFSLIPSHGSVNFFNIHPKTGEITTSAELDREETSVYNLIAAVNDVNNPQMSSTATVVVTLLDTNDCIPTFEYPSSDNNTIKISNLAHLGYEVTRVKAIDRDISRNGNVTYEFYKGNEEGYFSIDPLSGSISIAECLERIEHQLYQFMIVARDQGVPQMSAMTNLNIEVNKSIPFTYHQKPHLLGPNTTIVISLTCISVVVLLILIIAIVLIRQQDKNKNSQKYVEALKVLSAKDDSNNADNIGSRNTFTDLNSKTIQPREATIVSVGNGKVLVTESTELQTFSKTVIPQHGTTNSTPKVHNQNEGNHHLDAHLAAVNASRENNHQQYIPEVSITPYSSLPSYECRMDGSL